MVTLNLTNTSGKDIAPNDGVLPRSLSWVSLANGANVNVVFQAADMTRPEDPVHGGLSLGDKLQQLKQYGKITFTATAYGDTAVNGSVQDGVVHNV